MFRDRSSGFFLLRDVQLGQDGSLIPQVGDLACLKVDENNIEVRVKLERQENENWEGTVYSYHTQIKGRTPSERLEEIKSNEKFINENNLTNGTKISFSQKKIFGVHRG